MKRKVWNDTNSDGDKLSLEYIEEGLAVSYKNEDGYAGATIIPTKMLSKVIMWLELKANRN